MVASPKAFERTALQEWLLEGDPAIRWQARRDLLDEPARAWKKDRERIATEGWGARLLAKQDATETWAHGIYGPKWTSTTYTLLLLKDMGLPSGNAAAKRGCRVILERGLAGINGSRGAGPTEPKRTLDQVMCTCVIGMWLALPAYFRVHDDPKVELLLEHLLGEQMPDGGWNCRRRRPRREPTTHSSFHTTITVLEALRDAIESGVGDADQLRRASERAIEFMLVHRLYRSDRTGQIIKQAWTKFSFPPRWHYDVLRGLDYLRPTSAIHDKRCDDAFEVLLSRRRPDGTWAAQNKHAGRVFFELERGPSRWNTLRALRCLKARGLESTAAVTRAAKE